MSKKIINRFSEGFHDGVPIGLGYLSVSFTFGMMAVASGIPIWAAIAISMTCLTSAGQFAGVSGMAAGVSCLEIALSQLVINIRYTLMAVSLSQRLDKTIGTPGRMGIAFGITDEIFAVSSTKDGRVGRRYMGGLLLAPYFGWALGTALGALAGSLLPASVQSALGIAIYGMFLAIILPAAKQSHPVFVVLLIAVALSCLFQYLPILSGVSDGFVIIICSAVAALSGALLFPQKEE